MSFKNLSIAKLVIGLIVLFAFSCKDEDPNAQFNNEVRAIDDYLTAHVTDPVLYDQSGMRIVLKTTGNNPPPHAGQNIKLTYTAKLFSDNSVFASGLYNDKLENVFTQGLKYSLTALMSGSEATFYIPSMYAYGEEGTTGVPGNSVIVYDVKLEEVTRTAAEQTQFMVDTAAIHNYLKANPSLGNGAVQHPSGVWYKIDAPGTGNFPTPYSNVSFKYKGTVMSNGSVFDDSSLSTNVFALIDGLKVGIPNIRDGASANFYIPSGLGYGTQGSSKIPANANLIFSVQLNSIQ